MSKVNENIAKFRKFRKMTQADLARQLGNWKTSSVMRSVYLQSMEDDEAAKAVSTFVSTITAKVDTKCEKVDTD